MPILGKLAFGALFALLVAANGCVPGDASPLDEEKEPHFVLGKGRVNSMDYPGAVQAFTESLEANPRSAAAHFRLACLYDPNDSSSELNPVSDPAAAIYHYQEFLRLNPKANNAEVIRQRIDSCKVKLAANIMQLPSAPAAQKQLEDLTEKYRRLQDEVKKWRAYYAGQPAAQKNAPTPTPNPPAPSGSQTPDDISTAPVNPPPAKPIVTRTATVKPAPAPVRTHTVASGDTLANIARAHGISLAALQTANPNINPKKLHVGQTLNLPTN